MSFPQIADSKKVQTFLNLLGRSVEQVRAICAQHAALRAAWAEISPDVTGTPLEGVSLPAIAGWLDELEAWADTPIANGLVDAVRPNHREEF